MPPLQVNNLKLNEFGKKPVRGFSASKWLNQILKPNLTDFKAHVPELERMSANFMGKTELQNN